MTRSLRRAAEQLLLTLGAPRLVRRRVRGRTLILAYHNVVPDGLARTGDRPLHLPFSDFRAQLDVLATACDIVPLTAIDRPSGGPRPRAVITFDDAYSGAVTLGVEELARRGLPATVFVAPGLLGSQTVWWDELGSALGDAGVPPALRTEALDTWRGDGRTIRDQLAERGVSLTSGSLPQEYRTATEEQLTQAVKSPGIRLGAHSWSHPNLTALDRATIDREVREPLEWLRTRFPGVTDPWIAYPYGIDSPTVHAAAGAAGYAAGLRVHGRWMQPGALPDFATPRWNIPAGITAEGFALRLARVPGL